MSNNIRTRKGYMIGTGDVEINDIEKSGTTCECLSENIKGECK